MLQIHHFRLMNRLSPAKRSLSFPKATKRLLWKKMFLQETQWNDRTKLSVTDHCLIRAVKGSLFGRYRSYPFKRHNNIHSPSYEVKKLPKPSRLTVLNGVPAYSRHRIACRDEHLPSKIQGFVDGWKLFRHNAQPLHNSEAQRFVTAMRGRSTLWRQRSFSEIKPK